jgi:hypothetical protein
VSGSTVPAVVCERDRGPAIDPLAYPFDVPAAGFVWRAGEVASPGGPAGDLELSSRAAVLAIGSNASPAQLSRKFAAERFRDPRVADGVIPVVEAVAPDVDVVYAAHVASYGSVPATLVAAPGVRVHVFVCWLTPAQLARMNETEALGRQYDLVAVPGVRSGGRTLTRAVAYVSTAGVARFGGRPLALRTVAAEGRALAAATQADVWDRLALERGDAGGGAALVARVVADPAVRASVIAHLRAGHLPD